MQCSSINSMPVATQNFFQLLSSKQANAKWQKQFFSWRMSWKHYWRSRKLTTSGTDDNQMTTDMPNAEKCISNITEKLPVWILCDMRTTDVLVLKTRCIHIWLYRCQRRYWLLLLILWYNVHSVYTPQWHCDYYPLASDADVIWTYVRINIEGVDDWF